jgi:hypothetical protein
MAKEIRVYSMAVLDLLTCALGGTVLISFLLIVSMGQTAASGFPYDYFTVSGGVWVDVTGLADTRLGVTLVKRLLATAAGPVVETGTEGAENIRDLLGEYEVELQIYYQGRQGAPSPIPRGKIASPLLRVNTAREGAERRAVQMGAKFATNTSRLGLRRVDVNGKPRLFAAFRVSAAGFKVEPGWYFVDLSIIRYPMRGIAPETAAWLRIDCGGRPSAIRLMTHSPFGEIDEAEWPDGRGYANLLKDLDLGTFPADVLKDPAKIEAEMTKRAAPDLFIPGWPTGYPPIEKGAGNKGAAMAQAEAPEVAGSPRFEAVLVGREDETAPYFALRQRRGGPPAALPRASRFVIPPGNPTSAPGWVRTVSRDGITWDEYLPGFEIQEEKYENR